MKTLPIGLIGDIGGGEILLIAAAILLLFGGERLPSMARTIGKTVEGLRKASQDFKAQLLKADAPPLENPFKPTQNTPESKEGTKLRAARTHLADAPSPESAKETPPRDPAG